VRYFTLLWDPQQDPEYTKVFEEFADSGSVESSFSCGKRLDIGVGERVILRRSGRGSRGIVGAGTVVRGTYQDMLEGPRHTARNFVDVKWDFLNLDPVILTEDPNWVHVTQLWQAQAGGQTIDEAFGEALFNTVIVASPTEIREAGESSLLFSEGAASRRVITIQGRSASVRNHCLDHYGRICVGCGLDPAKSFGAKFRDSMDVHHLDPLAQSRDPRQTDPIRDCRPLCPNCHRLAYAGMPAGTCRSIDELVRIVSRQSMD